MTVERIRKELGASASVASRERLGAKGTPNSIIRIADLFDLVNGDAKKYIPQKEEQGAISYKLPVSKDVSDREMLVDMFEQMVTDSTEYKVLRDYKSHFYELSALEEAVEKLTAEIDKYSNSEGIKYTEKLKQLKLERQQAINRLNYYDGKLLGLEKSGVLKAMIERNRQKVTQECFDRARAYYKERNERREADIRSYYRESRRNIFFFTFYEKCGKIE